MRVRSQRGFTLVELVVTLAVIAALIAIGLPAYTGYRNSAYDRDAQSLLRTGLLAENVHHSDNALFTETAADLNAVESTIDYNVSGDPVDTVRVDVDGANAATEVCLFSRSQSGTWWAVYQSLDNGTYYGQSAPATCAATLASGWSTGGW